MFGLACLCNSYLAQALTWKEPWQEEVIRGADYFVLARVQTADESKGAVLQVLKTLGGSPLPSTVLLDDFYALALCSRSGEERPEFPFTAGDTTYFLLKKNSAGNYSIATPTSGYAQLHLGAVSATYRHSYHQALVPATVYEPTLTACFQFYHQQRYDDGFINRFVNEQLALPPAPMGAATSPAFFLQHVALEMVYHLRLPGKYELLLPFLRDKQNFHTQLSAVRALVVYPQACQELLAILSNGEATDFTKAVTVRTLAAYKPEKYKYQLLKLAHTASEQEVGFGGNIMDPRVCTTLPTVRASLRELVATLP